MQDKPQVYDYSHYRTFLKEYHQFQVGQKQGWSLGKWARQMDLGSTAVISNILKGARRPGPSVTKRLVRFFHFDKMEKDYFEALVQLDKVGTDPELTIMFMERLKNLQPKGEFKLLDDESFSAISKWYYYAIREMVAWPNFRPEAEWIKSRLIYNVDLPDIKEAIEVMVNLGVLKKTANGLEQANKEIKTSEGIANEAIKRFHEQMLDYAKESVRISNVGRRYLGGRTLNISFDKLPEAMLFLQQFRHEFAQKFESEGDSVYQLNCQLFPLTK